MRVTVSAIKADVGSLAGHHVVHPEQIRIAKSCLERAKREGKIIDYYVTNCGDDLQLLMTHTKGEDSSEIHELAWDTFQRVAKVSRRRSRPARRGLLGEHPRDGTGRR